MRWPQADTPVVSVFRQGMPMSSLVSMLYNTSPGSLPVLLFCARCWRDRVTGGGAHEGCWSDHLCALGSSPGRTRRDPVSVCAVVLRVLSSGDAVHDTDRSEWTWHPQQEAHTVQRCGLAMLWIDIMHVPTRWVAPAFRQWPMACMTSSPHDRGDRMGSP